MDDLNVFYEYQIWRNGLHININDFTKKTGRAIHDGGGEAHHGPPRVVQLHRLEVRHGPVRLLPRGELGVLVDAHGRARSVHRGGCDGFELGGEKLSVDVLLLGLARGVEARRLVLAGEPEEPLVPLELLRGHLARDELAEGDPHARHGGEREGGDEKVEDLLVREILDAQLREDAVAGDELLRDARGETAHRGATDEELGERGEPRDALARVEASLASDDVRETAKVDSRAAVRADDEGTAWAGRREGRRRRGGEGARAGGDAGAARERRGGDGGHTVVSVKC